MNRLHEHIQGQRLEQYSQSVVRQPAVGPQSFSESTSLCTACRILASHACRPVAACHPAVAHSGIYPEAGKKEDGAWRSQGLPIWRGAENGGEHLYDDGCAFGCEAMPEHGGLERFL